MNDIWNMMNINSKRRPGSGFDSLFVGFDSDSDADGVPDSRDCQPYNPFKQDDEEETPVIKKQRALVGKHERRQKLYKDIKKGWKTAKKDFSKGVSRRYINQYGTRKAKAMYYKKKSRKGKGKNYDYDRKPQRKYDMREPKGLDILGGF